MRQIIRYGVVGAISNTSLYLSYLLLTFLGMEHKIAMTLVYIIGASISFWGNRKWTFEHSGNVTRTALRYFFAQLAGYLLNLSILIVFVDGLGYPHQWIQAISVFVVAAFLFLACKYLVFSEIPEERT